MSSVDPILTRAGALAWLQERQEGVPPLYVRALFATPLLVAAGMAGWRLLADPPPAWGDLFGGFVTGTLVLWGLLAMAGFWLAADRRSERQRLQSVLQGAQERSGMVTRVGAGPGARTITVADTDGAFFSAVLHGGPGQRVPAVREGAPARIWVAGTGVVVGTCGALYEGGIAVD